MGPHSQSIHTAIHIVLSFLPTDTMLPGYFELAVGANLEHANAGVKPIGGFG